MRKNMMKLDRLSELQAVQNEPGNSLITFDCLRDLTREYVGRVEDANRLCGLLKAAEEAAARGDFVARAGFLSSYIDAVSAQAQQLDLFRKLIFRAALTLMRYPRKHAGR